MGRLRQGLTMCQWWRDTGTRRHISEFITWQFTSTKLWRRRTKVNVARILHFIICTLISVVSVSHVHSSPPLCLFAGFVWVVVGGLHRAQGVVDYPVVRLVRPYRQHHVPHGRVILETKSVRIYGPLTPTYARTITFTVMFKIGCMVPYGPIHTQLFSCYSTGKERTRDWPVVSSIWWPLPVLSASPNASCFQSPCPTNIMTKLVQWCFITVTVFRDPFLRLGEYFTDETPVSVKLSIFIVHSILKDYV